MNKNSYNHQEYTEASKKILFLQFFLQFQGYLFLTYLKKQEYQKKKYNKLSQILPIRSFIKIGMKNQMMN